MAQVQTQPNVGRPNIGKLLKEGRIANIDTLPNPTEEMTVKDKETGQYIVQARSRGAVKNPDDPVWRVGYNADKHAVNVRKEMKARSRGSDEKIAPDLSDEEFDDFKSKYPEEAAYIAGENDFIPTGPKKVGSTAKADGHETNASVKSPDPVARKRADMEGTPEAEASQKAQDEKDAKAEKAEAEELKKKTPKSGKKE